jgi:hypothetical protein
MLTRWIDRPSPTFGFTLGDECELKEPVDNGGVMRGRRIDLASDEVRSHLDAGMLRGQARGRPGSDRHRRPAVRRSGDPARALPRPGHGTGAETRHDDALARFDADFTLMGAELARFVPSGDRGLRRARRRLRLQSSDVATRGALIDDVRGRRQPERGGDRHAPRRNRHSQGSGDGTPRSRAGGQLRFV